MKIIGYVLMILALPALADTLSWPAVTQDIYKRPLTVPVTYQLYRDGIRLWAPQSATNVIVASCEQHIYTVTAIGLAESDPSNSVKPFNCVPNTPTISNVAGAKLAACFIDGMKKDTALAICQSKLNAAGIK